MNKLTTLLISSLMVIPLIGIANYVADNSKKEIKGNLNLCNLKVGDRGWVRGQVTSVDKREWYKRQTELGEGIQGCRLSISTHPNKDPLLQQIGARVRVLIKVDSEGQASVLNSKSTQEDLSVIGTDGSIVPVKATEQVVSKSLHNRMLKYDSFRINMSEENTSYLFSKDIIQQLQPSKPYKWFYQETSRGIRVINRVEPLH